MITVRTKSYASSSWISEYVGWLQEKIDQPNNHATGVVYAKRHLPFDNNNLPERIIQMPKGTLLLISLLRGINVKCGLDIRFLDST